MLSFHTIKPAQGAKHKRKRVGRGLGSCHGTYSCAGIKGQKARSGVSGLKRLGLKQMLLRTPKLRGFKSLQLKAAVVNLKNINESFISGETVNPETLFAKGLIREASSKVKILGEGKLEIKNLKFENVSLSANAKKQI